MVLHIITSLSFPQTQSPEDSLEMDHSSVKRKSIWRVSSDPAVAQAS